MNSGVYQLRSTVTGERYIGGSTNLRSRRLAHLSGLRSGKHRITRLQELATFDGIDSIAFEVLEECEPDQTLGREKEWIRTAAPELNAPGGEHSPGRPRLYRERLQITLPHGMADAVSDAAAERGWDRSRLFEELAREFLKGRSWAE